VSSDNVHAKLGTSVPEGRVRHPDSERLLRQMQGFINSLPNPVSYLGRDRRYQFVNDAFLRATRNSDRAHVIGQQFEAVRTPQAIAVLGPCVDRAMAGEACKVEWLPVFGGHASRWVQTEFFPDFNDSGQLIGVHAMSTDIHDFKIAHENVHALASTDVLTGLPNRLALSQLIDAELTRHRNENTRCAIIFIDLDGFKAINDCYGHRFGDSVLVASARRMASAVRAQDTIGRLGGDEFMAAVVDATDAEATRVARRLVEVVSKVLSVDGREVQLTASVGVAFFPEHGQDLDNLIRAADAAMYRAKGAGKNQAHVGV
jgi:diguanylate cyclase (GGDEF)-like protein